MKPKHGMGNGLGDVTIMLGKIGCRNNNRSWSLQRFYSYYFSLAHGSIIIKLEKIPWEGEFTL